MTPFEASLAGTAIKEGSGPLTSALKSWGSRKWDKFVATYTNAFSTYVENSRAKCEIVKNVLYRNQLAKTDDKYVSISFRSHDNSDIHDRQFIPALLSRRHILIKGRGGAGKTMFTKWLVLRLAESLENHQQIPVYIELRDIKDKDDSPFENLIFQQISTTRTTTTFNQFIEGIKAGIFVFILDAADEVRKSDRPAICQKLEAFVHTFPECGVLLTTRDFAEIENIAGFESYRTRSLQKDEAIQILKKLDYDEEVKQALIDVINSDKADKHEFFLSNPLLVTILLLTFDQSKEIPTKRSAIYKRAFEALYERHDTSKGIYRRDHHAGLPMDEFESVFSTFCFGTYVNAKIDFDEAELVPLFKAACELSGIDESAEAIAKDSHESVCLLTKEGHDYAFCHRSFQEYFVAVYLRDYRGDDLPKMIELALRRGQGEHVIEFLFEIDKKDLERHYILPNLRKIITRIESKTKESSEGARLIARHFFKSIKFREKDLGFAGLEFDSSPDASFLFGASAVYPELNLLQTVLRFEKSGVKYHGFDQDRAKSTASYVSKYNDHFAQKIVTLKFSPTAAEWFTDSEFEEKMLNYWTDLIRLRDRLELEYDSNQPTLKSRFDKFA